MTAVPGTKRSLWQRLQSNVGVGLQQLRIDKMAASALINGFLSKYFEGITHDKLEFAWSDLNRFRLSDLKLRRNASYELGLPVDIKLTCIKSLEVARNDNKTISISAAADRSRDL